MIVYDLSSSSTASSCPVTVTVCAALHSTTGGVAPASAVAPNTMLNGLTCASSVSLLAIDTVTVAVGARASRTVKSSVPDGSLVVTEVSDRSRGDSLSWFVPDTEADRLL